MGGRVPSLCLVWRKGIRVKNGLVWDCGCCMLLSNILWPKCQYDATAFVGDRLWERGELPCLAFLMIVLWILQRPWNVSPFAWTVVESDLWVKLRDPGPLHQPAAMAGHGDERIGAERVETTGKQLRLDSSNRNLQSICIYYVYTYIWLLYMFRNVLIIWLVCLRNEGLYRYVLYGWFVWRMKAFRRPRLAAA